MDLQLTNKVAIVMGASRGLGKAVAAELVREGARVGVCARHEDVLCSAAEELQRIGGRDVVAVRADVTVPEQLKAFIDAVIREFGRVDILVTNTGGPPPGRFLDLTPEDWEAAAQLTLMSAVRAIYQVIPVMQAQHDGSIVMINSFSIKYPVPALMLSNSLRMALAGLAKSLADELGASGIRVNGALPGYTRTERVDEILQSRARQKGTTPQQEAEAVAREIPLGRMATPEEFARAVVFLASPAASYINGIALPIDGGIIRTAL